jgi:hypothetical protein
MARHAVRVTITHFYTCAFTPLSIYIAGLPSLRRICSHRYLIALARLGSVFADGADIGGKVANLLLADALDTMVVWLGVSNWMFSGASSTTGCERPIGDVELLTPRPERGSPCPPARGLVKHVGHTHDHVVQELRYGVHALWGLASDGRVSVSTPFSCFSVISGFTDWVSVPLGPFTVYGVVLIH